MSLSEVQTRIPSIASQVLYHCNPSITSQALYHSVVECLTIDCRIAGSMADCATVLRFLLDIMVNMLTALPMFNPYPASIFGPENLVLLIISAAYTGTQMNCRKLLPRK